MILRLEIDMDAKAIQGDPLILADLVVKHAKILGLHTPTDDLRKPPNNSDDLYVGEMYDPNVKEIVCRMQVVDEVFNKTRNPHEDDTYFRIKSTEL